jgi:hypothetical protein
MATMMPMTMLTPATAMMAVVVALLLVDAVAAVLARFSA